MMTLVSELVLTRNQLMQMVRQEAESAFKAPLQRLSQITSELQDGVMTTRMQPIGNAWSNLPRVVRDLGLELGKQIELTMTGHETELDRQVLELIKDPLTHMVRNSADHGIETPAERRAAGKPAKGTISLNAYHEGGHIMIEIADDGRGLDVERIGAKALASGLVTEGELQAMSPQQIQQFIFRPGFSTAGQVTNVSGRGVGMDVVRSNIERIGGTIELNAQAGRSTRFTVKIPLTLAIIAALIVETGGERFAIPQISVLELVRAGTRTEHQIEVVGGALLLRLRERLLPLMPLAGLLGLRDDDALHTAAEAHVVVCQVGAAMLGLIVDRVFDTEEIVVKPVAPLLRGLNAFSGNTILGDGSVVMILDLNGLVAASGAAVAETAGASEETAVLGSTASLLLFRAGYGAPKAVPLALVTRIEEAAAEAVELASGRPVMQYRGRLMPLSTLDGQPVSITEGRRPVLVFGDGERTVGLVVDEIIDVAEQRIEIARESDQPWCLGSVIIGERSVDLIDVGAVVTGLFGSFEAAEGKPERAHPEAGRRLLLVDDSAFFRHMLEPVLMTSGYEVVAVDSPTAALRLRDRGEAFDIIVSDIEMPGMDGFAFAAACRSEGAWQEVPIVALSSRTAEADLARAREAGFSDYVGKLDRGALLEALRQSMVLREEAAA
jgi:two-component system, chemotaxis family, sensor kinase CheA